LKLLILVYDISTNRDIQDRQDEVVVTPSSSPSPSSPNPRRRRGARFEYTGRYIWRDNMRIDEAVVGWVEGRSNKRFAARSSCPETQRLETLGFALFFAE
jgi:hypothetical protein